MLSNGFQSSYVGGHLSQDALPDSTQVQVQRLHIPQQASIYMSTMCLILMRNSNFQCGFSDGLPALRAADGRRQEVGVYQ